ncbi:unnamed protein product [Brachionus calyciflorus]|uniref:Uncharacterized protein n=1 Tax=Brachionus calyciflorus TaxID=104777 RepID=A0A814GUP7_9BILA|nr:unnamed protein product [Brachionus calyciflorus]
MLTNQHREMIKNEIKFQYNIDINEKQISHLIVDEFNCNLRIDCPNDYSVNSVSIKGKAHNLRSFPLRIDFKMQDKKHKACFDNILENILNKTETDDELTFECIENTDLNDKLFGTASSVYVTRNQLANLASTFDELIDKIIQNIETNKKFEKIPFEVAINSLSKFSLKDTEPDVINSELKISEKNEQGVSYKASVSVLGMASGSSSIDYVKNSEKRWKNLDIHHQLNDLNKESTNNIEWKFEVIKTLNGHSKWISSLAVLPDGNLESGSDDTTIKIWNTNYGSVIKTLNGHSEWVECLAVLPDGNLTSGSDDITIKIWKFFL